MQNHTLYIFIFYLLYFTKRYKRIWLHIYKLTSLWCPIQIINMHFLFNYWKVKSLSILSRCNFGLENITEYFPHLLKEETATISTWFQTLNRKMSECIYICMYVCTHIYVYEYLNACMRSFHGWLHKSKLLSVKESYFKAAISIHFKMNTLTFKE